MNLLDSINHNLNSLSMFLLSFVLLSIKAYNNTKVKYHMEEENIFYLLLQIMPYFYIS